MNKLSFALFVAAAATSTPAAVVDGFSQNNYLSQLQGPPQELPFGQYEPQLQQEEAVSDDATFVPPVAVAAPAQPDLQQQQIPQYTEPVAPGSGSIAFYGTEHQANRQGGKPAMGKTPPSIQRSDGGLTMGRDKMESLAHLLDSKLRGDEANVSMGHDKMESLDHLLDAKVRGDETTDTMGHDKIDLLNDLLTSKVHATADELTLGRDKMVSLDHLLDAKVRGDETTDTMGHDKMELLNDLLTSKVHDTADDLTLGRDKMESLDHLLDAKVRGDVSTAHVTMGRNKIGMLDDLLGGSKPR